MFTEEEYLTMFDTDLYCDTCGDVCGRFEQGEIQIDNPELSREKIFVVEDITVEAIVHFCCEDCAHRSLN